MTVGIVGAGASGMAAALAASENENVNVILLERQARVGRKLQATGNGRCNLSNVYAGDKGYHGEDPAFVQQAFAAMNPADTLAWFHCLGLFTVTENSGKVYPYSDQANSVVDVLRLALVKPNIELRTGFEVQKISKSDGKFIISNGEETVICDKVVVACGGLAGTKLGGSMSGYKLLGKFGHKSTRLRPCLVQLKSNWGGLASLKGVRANCNVKIYNDEKLYAESTGELQFTDYGLSGPVIFEVSRDACLGAGEWIAVLDLIPHCDAQKLTKELQRRANTELPIEELLTGILHNRLGRVLTKAAGVTNKQTTKELTDIEIETIVKAVKTFEIVLTEPMGMENAQVTAGGILTRDFDPNTMESKLVPGLYACGEVLDIDGDCGGYNLQWAWSSGFLAGKSVGGSL
ncbi:MAG: aminoacetone oxidase family FAD-binding enzyme [Oscillospiraceae bacterium]|nr:aminoacetone oxidase family FAD-binding enzyme [Oscillospiraceae bacterium]